MRSRRMLSTVALVASLALAVSGCGDDDDGADVNAKPDAKPTFAAGSTMARLSEAGKVKIGTKFDQPLFGLKGVSGNPEGFDVEIGKIIASELGIDESGIEWVESISKNREDYIVNGTVDFVVATYTINDKRKLKVAFAGPYYTAGQDIMVKKGNTTIKGESDLAGKTVCSVTGSTPAAYVKEKIPTAKLTLFGTYTECAEAMRNGQVEATTTDNVILMGLVSKSPDEFELVAKPFTEEPYGIGVKKEDTDFRTFVNDVLEEIYEDGRYKAAYDKTIGTVQAEMPAPPSVNRY
ncbi:MAG TPA: glutamate ABC transporter substrate-binding protein [Mycobacteriales bacterium]|nr:glutamate ABC transporter substrate-binding protein [Mycobacteriales bacterium]